MSKSRAFQRRTIERGSSGFTDRRVPKSDVKRHYAGRLIVTCWCEDTMVVVPEADVRAGRTYSCGLRRCTPELVKS